MKKSAYEMLERGPEIIQLESSDKDPRRGFRDAGEFFLAVRKEGNNFSNPSDNRLQRLAVAPTTFGNESSGPDGGFAVPIEFATEIADLATTDDSLLPFCDCTPISKNSMVFPQDETTPWGTTGARAFWQNEASLGQQIKPALRGASLRLNKIIALCPVTDELQEDAPALGSYVVKQAGKSIRWKVNEALLFGPGEGQPLGVYSSNAQITIAKEGGQATQTIDPKNITKMMSRLPPGSFGSAIWLISGDSLTAFFAITTLSSIYWPTGKELVPEQNRNNVFGLIMGRPAFISAHAKAFSSQGDFMLLDMQYVRVIQKVTAQIAQSMHIYFDADCLAFRITFRIDAQPKITSTIAPANGTTQLSPFVQLGAR